MTPLRSKRITVSNRKSFTLNVSKKEVQPAKWPKFIDCSMSRFKGTTYIKMDKRLQLCLEF